MKATNSAAAPVHPHGRGEFAKIASNPVAFQRFTPTGVGNSNYARK